MLPSKICLNLPQGYNSEAHNEHTVRDNRIDSYIYLNNQIIPVMRYRLKGC
jgi:hypothetical protein